MLTFGMYCAFDVYLILYFFPYKISEAIANMDDDFILLQIYDETQDEVRDKDLEVRKIEAKVQKLFTTISYLNKLLACKYLPAENIRILLMQGQEIPKEIQYFFIHWELVL